MSFFLIFSWQINICLLLFTGLDSNRQLIIKVRKKVLDWWLEYGRGSLVVLIKVLNVLYQGRIPCIEWRHRIRVCSRWFRYGLVRSIDDWQVVTIIFFKVIWFSSITDCINGLKVGMNDLFLYPTWIPFLGLLSQVRLRLVELEIIFGLENVVINLFFLQRFILLLLLLYLLL